jgi:hypothetical protein
MEQVIKMEVDRKVNVALYVPDEKMEMFIETLKQLGFTDVIFISKTPSEIPKDKMLKSRWRSLFHGS